MSVLAQTRRGLAAAAALGAIASSATFGQEGGSQVLLDPVTAALSDARPTLVEIRRDLHMHPELSGEEVRTAGIVAEHLRAAGFEVRAGVGGHGVVGLLRGPESGPVIAFRADMDAVRSQAPDPVDFRSVTPGVRHICGHDIHTTIGLGLATGFAAVRDRLAGSVMLIFQPAEESASGARAMLADGVFVDTRPDAIFAFHTAPAEVGQVGAAFGVQMPGRDAVRVHVRGTGDLERVARAARDVVLAAGTISNPSAPVPTSEAFVFVGGAGVAPEEDAWIVRATLTTSGAGASRDARSAIEAGLSELERPGMEIELAYEERWIDGVTNDPALVEAANASARGVLGEAAVQTIGSVVPAFSEDFGSFQAEVPGAMYFLGVSNSERGWVGMPHTPDYVADEESIFVGARAMAAIILDLHTDGVP